MHGEHFVMKRKHIFLANEFGAMCKFLWHCHMLYAFPTKEMNRKDDTNL